MLRKSVTPILILSLLYVSGFTQIINDFSNSTIDLICKGGIASASHKFSLIPLNGKPSVDLPKTKSIGFNGRHLNSYLNNYSDANSCFLKFKKNARLSNLSTVILLTASAAFLYSAAFMKPLEYQTTSEKILKPLPLSSLAIIFVSLGFKIHYSKKSDSYLHEAVKIYNTKVIEPKS